MAVFDAILAAMFTLLLAVGGGLLIRGVWRVIFGHPEVKFGPKDAPDLFVKTRARYRLRDTNDPGP